MPMPRRDALLIRCSVRNAEEVRDRAASEHRTISGYLLHILARRLNTDDRLAGNITANLQLARPEPATPVSHAQPRTALLLRCSVEEASRIRSAARRRRLTISEYVLYALHITWRFVPATPTV